MPTEATVASYPEFNYAPVHHFMRCHSHNDNPADGQTKVWRCAFEPDPEDNKKWTGIVATCGGAYVCLIDAEKGECSTKLRQHEDQYFDVVWTTVKFADGVKTNVLASAGYRGRVTLMHPSKYRCFAHIHVFKHYMSCLRIHPCNPDWIFCGAEHGKICLVDMGLTGAKDYQISYKKLRKFHCPGTDIIQMLVREKLIIAAAQKGCFVWNTEKATKLTSEVQDHDYQLAFPGSTSSENYCDGLAALDDTTMATKFSRSNSIYIWSLDVLKKGKKGKAQAEPMIKVTPQLILPWVKTTEIYIDITSRNGMLVAGDPVGNIILYSLGDFLKAKADYGDKETPQCQLTWPVCKPNPSDPINKRLKLIDNAPLINHASFSPDMKYLVACTDNNLVCIWKKQ